MTGWKIFSHSVFLLNHNLKDAVRLSSPLIVMMVIGLAVGTSGTVPESAFAPSDGQSENLVLQLLTGVAGLWVAVSWHRFVLLEETGGSLPSFHGRRMLAYFVVFFLFTLTLSLALVVFAAFASAVAGSSIAFLFLVAIVISAVAIWGFYRLSPLLPAAALGQSLGVKEAWQATSEISGAVLLAGLLIIFFSVVSVAAVLLIMLQVNALIGLAMLGVLQWAFTMIGISVLTTIYGISVEGRQI